MTTPALMYKDIFAKVASSSDERTTVSNIFSTYQQVKKAGAIDQSSLLLAAGLGAVPAYLLGDSLARNEERDKRMKYLAAGAAAGAGVPLLYQLISGSGSGAESMGIDADYIKGLQAKAIK